MESSPLSMILPLLLLVAAFYFLIIRPGKKRQADAARLQSSLAVGAQVQTIGGMRGYVVDMDEEEVVVETTPGNRLRFVHQAIAKVIEPEPLPMDDAIDDNPSES